MIGNALAVAIAIANFIVRLGDPAAAIVPTGLALSGVVVLILAFTGWRGGDLTYHHRVGVLDDQGEEPGRPA